MSRPSIDQIVRLRITTEMIDQDFAQPRDAADERDVFVHAIFAQEGFGIDAVDQQDGIEVAQFAELRARLCEALDRSRVVERKCRVRAPARSWRDTSRRS